MAESPEPQKKGRLSNMFKRKKVPEQIVSPRPEYNDRSPSAAQTHDSAYGSSTTQNHDSAYASSEPPSTHASEPNIVPVENRGQIENVSADRNLALNKKTGDVLDQDTGEVLSTVTTTTTTTTTTTMKKGKDGNIVVDVQTQPVGQSASQPAAQPQNQPATREEAPMASSHPIGTGIVEAPGDFTRLPAPSGVHGPGSVPPRMSQPTIPPRSPHRRSRDMSDMLNQPPQHDPAPQVQLPGFNFSRPERNSMRQSGDFNSQVSAPSSRSPFDSLRQLAKEQTSPDTYQQLKAAAKGLHGVGETIRGALNNELDHRVPVGDVQAAALKNQNIMERGRGEMGHIPEQRDHVVSPIQPSQQQQNWPRSRSASRSSGGKKGMRKLIKKKSR